MGIKFRGRVQGGFGERIEAGGERKGPKERTYSRIFISTLIQVLGSGYFGRVFKI